MTNYKDNLPPYAEERIIEQPTDQQVIQEILNKFKQPIPTGFVQLKVEEGNYICSTNPKWKDKPLCERYGFYLEDNLEKWIQIDIAHELMETLELNKGEDITHPLYLSPDALDVTKKKPVRGAVTIKNEEEIFIDKPVSEKGAERELIKRLGELERLREKIKNLEEDKQTSQETINNLQTLLGINDLNNLPVLPAGETLTSLLARPTLIQLNDLRREKDQELTTKNTQITNLTNQFNSLQTNYNTVNNELTTAKRELGKERGWCDTWMRDDGRHFITIRQGKIYLKSKSVRGSKSWELTSDGCLGSQMEEKEMKQFIKEEVYKFWSGNYGK